MAIGFPIAAAETGHGEPGVVELSISPALVPPFCEVAREFFLAYGGEAQSHKSGPADVNAFIEHLCLDHDDFHACNKTNFGIRMSALAAMTMIGLPDLVPAELWQTNDHGVATPSPSLIRAAMVVPWPVIAADDPLEEAARQAWRELIERCVAIAVSPLGVSAITTQPSGQLH